MFPFDQSGQRVGTQINVGGDACDPVRGAAHDLLAACEASEEALRLFQRWVDICKDGPRDLEDPAEDAFMEAEARATELRRYALAKAKGGE